MHPRQTLSYLRNLLFSHGISPKNKLGQNFLIDLNILDLIVRSAQVNVNDLVLEVGTGTGSLTTRLAECARAVLTVEVDSSFHSLAGELLNDTHNVTMVHMDVLKNKNNFNPDWLAHVETMRSTHPNCALKVVANLPYAVATPVIANLLISDIPVELFVVTVQWEIAQRLIAKPSSKEYSALAVLVQSLADVSLVRKLPPSVFWPRPQVDSAIVAIQPNAEKRQQVPDVMRFRNFLRDLYSHRRKNLRSSLSTIPGTNRSKQDVDVLLEGINLSGAGRAQDLSLEEHLLLCETFAPRPSVTG